MKIPHKDVRIVSALRKNARESLTTMARTTGIPVSTIFDRMKVHHGRLITKHTCLLDFNELGYPTRAKAIIKVDRKGRESIRSYLKTHPNVNSLYKINSGFDFMFELVFRNIKELEDFMEALDENHNIIEKKVYYIVDDIKREDFLATHLPALFD